MGNACNIDEFHRPIRIQAYQLEASYESIARMEDSVQSWMEEKISKITNMEPRQNTQNA